ncbi:ABC transporter permease subunit [Spirochaeta dissipatitropha]
MINLYDSIREKNNNLFFRTSGLLAMLSGAFLAAVIALLIIQAASAFIPWPGDTPAALIRGFLFGRIWQPAPHGLYGVLPLLAVTVLTAFTAGAAALLLVLPASLFVSEYLSPRSRRRLQTLVERAEYIPAVIYGVFGLRLVVPFLERYAGFAEGRSLAAGIIVMLCMTLPASMAGSIRAFQNVPAGYRSAAAVLGAGPFQTAYQVVLPAARRRICAVFLRTAVRAAGEAAAFTMVAGNSPQIPQSISASVRSLTGTILLEMGHARGTHSQLLFAAGILLFLLVLFMQAISIHLEKNSLMNSPHYHLNSPAGDQIRTFMREGHWRGNWLFFASMAVSALVSLVLICGIPLYIFISSILRLHLLPADLLSVIIPVLSTSALVLLYTLIFSLLPALSAAVYLTEYRKESRIQQAIFLLLDTMKAVPPIVYGLLGFLLFTRFFSWGQSILSASATLSLMLFPQLLSSFLIDFQNLPAGRKSSALALSASGTQVFFRLTLPGAFSSLGVSVSRALARAIGEAAPLMLTLGVAGNMPLSIMDSGRSMSVHIYYAAQEASSDPEIAAMYFSATLLLALVSALVLFSPDRNSRNNFGGMMK